MELKYRFIFIQPTAKEITCPVSHSRCAQKQSLSVAAQSPNPRESRVDRSPARAPRRQPLPPPSEVGVGIGSLGKGKAGRTVPAPRRTWTGTPVAPGVPLGLRRLLTCVEKMCWKTLLLLLLCYDAQATVSHRWSRGELLFIICLMLIVLF